jgi:hypothetical protein
MRYSLTILLFLFQFQAFSQNDPAKSIRAFPITDYIVELSDSLMIVQLHLPGGPVLKEKEAALLKGTYDSHVSDTLTVGYGNCSLIKTDYYYFTIKLLDKARRPSPGDILYTKFAFPDIYRDRFADISSHLITLLDVFESPFFDHEKVFTSWKPFDEKAVIDSIVKDIQFTGQHFIATAPEMDKLITTGKYKDRKILYVMAECQPEYVREFLDYLVAKPSLYAGRKWKVSEIFATWLGK